MSALARPEILGPLPRAARFLRLVRPPSVSVDALGAALQALRVETGVLVGLGPRLVAELGGTVPGLGPLPTFPDSARVAVPHTPGDLWLRVAGADLGEVLWRAEAVLDQLPSGLVIADQTDGFDHAGGRDLSGYEDGTENPEGEAAVAAALVQGQGPGLNGGSVVAIQRWTHDLAAFRGMSKTEQDHAIGRERISNEELDEAPESAHVKRTAQEDFAPEAFVLRRSMPWSDSRGAGLVFVAFGASLGPFTALLRRMTGAEDGLVDGLFRFTRPVDGAVYWCPPLAEGRLDLRSLST